MGRSNIVLIGMPGSGKSTVGVLLAKALGYDFVDTDLLIQLREGCTLEELLRRKGIDAFLDIEGEVCAALEAENTVIATGGSAVYREHAMERLRADGRLVYLQVELPELTRRLSDLAGRGVALREGQTLEDLYTERIALYERWADLTVAEGDMTLAETVAAAAKAVAAL
jgi:shikimate kinase